MTPDELIAILRLQHITNIGDITAKKLISHCGSANAIFDDKVHHLLKIDGIGALILKELGHTSHLAAAYSYINENSIEYTYFEDKHYPRHLKHCINAPMLMFRSGNMDLQAKKMISSVGTRNMTSYGAAFCEELIEDLVFFISDH